MKHKTFYSSVAYSGKLVTQIYHFIGGEKRTFEHLKTNTIKQGQFTKIEMVDGRMLLINDKNILCIETIPEESK